MLSIGESFHGSKVDWSATESHETQCGMRSGKWDKTRTPNRKYTSRKCYRYYQQPVVYKINDVRSPSDCDNRPENILNVSRATQTYIRQ